MFFWAWLPYVARAALWRKNLMLIFFLRKVFLKFLSQLRQRKIILIFYIAVEIISKICFLKLFLTGKKNFEKKKSEWNLKILNFGARCRNFEKKFERREKFWKKKFEDPLLLKMLVSSSSSIFVFFNFFLFCHLLSSRSWGNVVEAKQFVLCLDDLFGGLGVPGCLDRAAPSYGLTR